MLKFWGRISSINVRKVVLTAQLLELPFDRIDAGAAFGVTKTPEYLARNPNALVPTLDAWMQGYNAERTHSGKYCYGKTPLQTFLESATLAYVNSWIGCS
jgi:hypothetical protein